MEQIYFNFIYDEQNLFLSINFNSVFSSNLIQDLCYFPSDIGSKDPKISKYKNAHCFRISFHQLKIKGNIREMVMFIKAMIS